MIIQIFMNGLFFGTVFALVLAAIMSDGKYFDEREETALEAYARGVGNPKADPFADEEELFR